MNQIEAWAAVMQIAQKHGLILSGYGGIVVLIHPDIQKEESVFDFCQCASGLGPNPQIIEQQRILSEQS